MSQKMRLDSYLVHTGLGSKKEMKQAIKRGRVSLNGELTKICEAKVDLEKDSVTLDGKKVDYQAYYYYMYHKPKGFVCASKDKNELTIFDNLPKYLINQGVFSVGRLDKDTTGLLLLTTDGKWDHSLRHPKYEKEKCYELSYLGVLSDDAEIKVKEGIDLGDFRTLPGQLERLGQGEARLTIKEGKFHQVKRMIHALGGEVCRLHRKKIGALVLDEMLKEGEFRPLTKDELISLGGERHECL